MAKAVVTHIQVGGGVYANSLEEACVEFLGMVSSSSGYRAKINFTIKLPDGTIKTITIRDEDEETVAYGDFAGLPDFLEYSREIQEGK